MPEYSLESLASQAQARFAARYGRRPTVVAAAPGRVNLIGEHTDYNGGFVLPMAIDRYTVFAADRGAGLSHVYSAAAGDEDTFSLELPLARGTLEWTNYVRGVVAGFAAKGIPSVPFDAVIESTVPLGGGLSSSAALEVATATGLEALSGTRWTPAEKALLCQWAEHQYAQVPCGIMDQFTSVFGRADHLLLLDCRSQETVQVPLADPEVEVLIINSNVRHALSGGEYAARRSDCEQAAQALGVKMLRDIGPAEFAAEAVRLDAVHRRRARHVVSEIARTVAAAEAVRQGDWPAVGELMAASHDSLRDDFEVSCLELDLLVDLAHALGRDRGVFGSRMTGGGFGGCTVSLVRRDASPAIAAAVRQAYHAKVGIEPTIFASRPAAGARLLDAN